MRVAGLVRLLSVHPNGPVADGGRMALADHLREFRARILRSAIVITVGIVIAFFFYHQLLDLVLKPYDEAKQALGKSVDSQIVISGVGGPLMLNLKMCSLAGLVATSPYWLYQIWAFIVPGLHPQERRWSHIFAAVAGPLFILGVGIGYYVLPSGLRVLINFTPADVSNLVQLDEYLTFLTQMLLVFGIAFEIPLFVVLLSLAGVVSGRILGEYRPWIIMGVFVFAAVATPSTDPWSMLFLAIPMTILFLISEVIARFIDRRRGRAMGDQWDDERASDLDYEIEDVRASDLDDDDE